MCMYRSPISELRWHWELKGVPKPTLHWKGNKAILDIFWTLLNTGWGSSHSDISHIALDDVLPLGKTVSRASKSGTGDKDGSVKSDSRIWEVV